MYGHERAACWYLNQMNLSARRLPDFGKRRRYAIIRKHAGKKGKWALKNLAKELNTAAEVAAKGLTPEAKKKALYLIHGVEGNEEPTRLDATYNSLLT